MLLFLAAALMAQGTGSNTYLRTDYPIEEPCFEKYFRYDGAVGAEFLEIIPNQTNAFPGKESDWGVNSKLSVHINIVFFNFSMVRLHCWPSRQPLIGLCLLGLLFFLMLLKWIYLSVGPVDVGGHMYHKTPIRMFRVQQIFNYQILLLRSICRINTHDLSICIFDEL